MEKSVADIWSFLGIEIIVISVFITGLILSVSVLYGAVKSLEIDADFLLSQDEKKDVLLRELIEGVLKVKLVTEDNLNKVRHNMQLITDKLNEMNGYPPNYSEEESIVVESKEEVQETPPAEEVAIPKEIAEGNEALPNNVIPFPTKKPK
jgi:hypothetical protein